MVRVQVKKYKKGHWGRHNKFWAYDAKTYYVYLPKRIAEKFLDKELKIRYEVGPPERVVIEFKSSEKENVVKV